MRPRPSNSLSDWWKIVAMGTVLAGLVFVAFFHEPDAGLPEGSGPPVREVSVATPELDPALLSLAKDATRPERILIEPQPLAHLLAESIDVVPSVAKALGMPEQQVPISRLRANPEAYRGRYLWYKGQLRYVSRGKSGHPVRGYKIWEGWLETEDGEPVVFRVSLEPRDVEVGDFVRIEGFFMKLHDRHDAPRADQMPVLVGPELFPDFPPWVPVAELDPEIMAQVDDTWDRESWNSLSKVGGAWEVLSDAQYLPLWHLTSYARTKAEEMSPAAWRRVRPFVTKEQLDRVRAREAERGEPVRVLGAFVNGQTWEARPNPLGIEYWSEAWVQVHDLGGKLIPVWIPGRIDHVQRGASLDVHAHFFKLRVYEAAPYAVETPQFVAASLDPFTPRPEHAFTSIAKWAFAAAVIAVIGMLVALGLRDRRRHAEHQREMDDRRRRRRAALATPGE